MPDNFQFKSMAVAIGAEIRDVDVTGRTVCAYFSSFNIPDDNRPYQDVMCKGAFSKTISEQGPGSAHPRVKYLWQHDERMPLGNPKVLKEDDFGLYQEAAISDTSFGHDVLILYQDGVITEHSIGYIPIVTSLDRDKSLRYLKECRLFDTSAVTYGMNSYTPTVGLKRMAEAASRLDSVLHSADLHDDQFCARLEAQLKAWQDELAAMRPAAPAHERITTTQEDAPMTLDEIKALVAASVRQTLEEKDATGKTTWPLADRDTKWDSGEAHKRIVAWAKKDDGSYDESKLKSVHFYSPGGDAGQNISAYKLLFCDQVSGEIKAIPNAIVACYGSHGVDAVKGVEEGDKEAIKKKISTYAAKMRKEFDDATFEPPWEQDGEKARQGRMRRKGFSYIVSRGDYRARLQQQLAAGQKDYQGTLAGMQEDLQQCWADAWNALALCLRRDMCDAVWGPIGETDKPDVKELIGADFDQAKAYFLELAEKSVAADFVPCGDDDGDGFYNPEDGDDDYGMMSARTPLALKEGRKMSAANHKAMSAAHGKIEEGLKEAKALMGKLKPSDAGKDDGEADTSDGSPDNENDAKGAKSANTGAGAGSHTTGASPAGAPEQATPATDGIASIFNDVLGKMRAATGVQSNGSGH